MASQTELEEMVVRLTGDAQEYQKMLKDAVEQTTKAANQVKEAAQKIEESGGHVKKFGEAIAGAFEAYAIKEFLKDAKKEWQESERQAVKLSAVLKSQGADVEEMTERYERFADVTMKKTTLDDDEVKALLKKAATFNLVGTKAEKAVSDAIALGEATDQGAESMLKFTIALAKGDTERAMMFTRMIPQLRGIKDEEELVAKSSQLIADGWMMIGEDIKTGGGKAAQATVKWGNMVKKVGEIFSEFPNPIKKVRNYLVDTFMEADKGTQKWIVSIGVLGVGLLSIGPTIALLTPVISVVTSGFVAMGTAVKAIIMFRPIEFFTNLATQIKTVGESTKAATAAMIGLRVATAAATAAALYGWGMLYEKLSGNEEKMRKIREHVEEMGKGESREMQGKIDLAGDNPEKLKALEDDFKGIQANLKQAREEMDGFGLMMARNMPMTTKLTRKMIEDWEENEDRIKRVTDALEKVREKQAQLEADAAKNQNKGWAKDMADKIAKTKELSDATREMNESLQNEIDTFDMSADEAKLYGLIQKGLTEEMEAQIRKKIEMKQVLEKEKEINQKIQRTIEDMRTPQEKYNERVAELQEMLAHGLPQKTFEEGMKKAQKDLDDATKKADKATAAIQKFDSALTGSAEAASRIAAYRDMLNTPNDKGVTSLRARQGGGPSQQAISNDVWNQLTRPAVQQQNQQKVADDVMKQLLTKIEQNTRKKNDIVLDEADIES